MRSWSSAATPCSTVKPSRSRRWARASPDSSRRDPAATPSLTVRTKARVPSGTRHASGTGERPPPSATLADSSRDAIAGPANGGSAGSPGRTLLPGAMPLAALPARLLEEVDRPNLHATLDALDHVVRRERGD